jgi:hypothetical protein
MTPTPLPCGFAGGVDTGRLGSWGLADYWQKYQLRDRKTYREHPMGRALTFRPALSVRGRLL